MKFIGWVWMLFVIIGKLFVHSWTDWRLMGLDWAVLKLHCRRGCRVVVYHIWTSYTRGDVDGWRKYEDRG